MSKFKWLLILGVAFTACHQKQSDSAEKADSTNMTKDSGERRYPVTVGQEISGDDAKFAVEAAAGGMEEVALGKLAQQKGSSQAVKDFGAMMVKDHTTANNELTTLATSKHIVLPKELDAEGVKLQKELTAKSGQEFDKAYVDAMVKDHAKDTSAFARATRVVKYPEMIAFAKKTLPILKMHLDAATKIKSSEK